MNRFDARTMTPVSIRLRRAIHLNDLSLVKRIVKNNPKHLQNPDLDDNGNTSLHLAARLGLLEITVSSGPPTLEPLQPPTSKPLTNTHPPPGPHSRNSS